MENIKKHAFKIQIGTAVAVISFIVLGTWNIAVFKNDIDKQVITLTNQYNHCHKWYEALEERQKISDEANQSQDLVIVEIRTKLNNIESLLVDLKHKLE